ncbi:MAG TPA: response regulator, partial [Vicinamibacteria bacterium]|nr:response regulator [Vicinamibacteria bacterium]
LAPARTRRRKSVLLIDDDPATREAAVAELEQAQVPARAVADGNAGIQAIAAEKPDVIALELDVGGNLAAKDVINMIKATMEWVDIPIILYTRLPLESQKEARTVHGADDLVLKRSGPAALVSRVITAFRSGS